jgi:hypothetical protein
MGAIFQPIDDHQEAASANFSEAPPFEFQRWGSWFSDEVYPERFESRARRVRIVR